MLFSKLPALFLVFTLTVMVIQVSANIPFQDSISRPRESVVKLLKNPEIKLTSDQNVRISFFITADNEVVVLKTDTHSPKLDKFIKERMNYKKIDAEFSEINRIYHIRVKFRAPHE